MNHVIQVIPAEDWFFIARSPEPMEPALCIYRIAAWGLLVNGSVIGLIGVPNFTSVSGTNKSPHLCQLPPLDGIYKHMEDLTDQEITALNQDGYLRLNKYTHDDVH